jgi:cytochrome c oxidase cbb3-type subunit 1
MFTFWGDAIFYIGVYGFFTMIALAGIYFMMPRLIGREWKSPGFINFHFTALLAGYLIVAVGLLWGGLAHGNSMANLDEPFTYVSFITWAPVLFASSGFLLIALGQIAFLVQLMYMIFACPHSCSAGDEGPAFLAPKIDERSNA